MDTFALFSFSGMIRCYIIGCYHFKTFMMKTVLKTVVVFCLAFLNQGRSFAGERPASLARLRQDMQEKMDDLKDFVGRSAIEAKPTPATTSTTYTKAAR